MTASLGDQVSKKISAWILIFVVTIIITIFFVSFFLSQRMFDRQIKIWNALIPQQVLTNLIDSDDFPITKEVELVKSTGLFLSFTITDNTKRIISQFGSSNPPSEKMIPIKDGSNSIWGYYLFKPNYYHFVVPFAITSGIFLFLIFCIYFIFRWRIRADLEVQFSQFNNFLKEIESVTQKIHLIYSDEFAFNESKTKSHEQEIINSAVSKLIDEIRKANQSLKAAIASAEHRRFQEELTRMALQVVHDIGSPLGILEVMQLSPSIPEEIRIIIKNANSKIRDITNTFLKKAKNDLASSDEPIQQMLTFLIAQVVSEKRMQYGDDADIYYESNEKSYGIFALINPMELSRVLSNIINNSVEAIELNKTIVVSLFEADHEAVIQIKDHGKGIAKDVLNELGKFGKSYGKSHGTGIGLNHAFQSIKENGGHIDIKSVEGSGTTVQIFLPKCQPPYWFIPTIKVKNDQQIVIVDDEENIHRVWERKFQELQKSGKIKLNIIHLYSPDEFIEWKAQNKEDKDRLFLCDYVFNGSRLNGIDLIKQLKINSQSILVTSKEVDEITAQCESEKIKIIPKSVTSTMLIVQDKTDLREAHAV